ncbi:MAG: thiolase family protein [Thermoplasmata archaeon]|nr:thiolase family protein [Candidatus Sysuiplasma jiujiangense]
MPAIVSAGFSRFGKREDSILSIISESALPIVRKYRDEIDFVILSNSYSGEFNGVSGLNNLATTYLSIDDTPSMRVDNTSGSGGGAILAASSLIKSGDAKRILVIGAEKMSEKPTREVTSIISSLLGEREKSSGISLPSLAGLMTKRYMEKYGASRESVAKVAVKNHENGARNPYAHIQKRVTLEEVLSSRTIVEPLKLYEISPISDGSSSLLMVDDAEADSYTDRPVFIRGMGIASDSSYITEREELTELKAVERAGEIAMRAAGTREFDFAELHDMATILEIVQSEALGFFEKGKGWKAVTEGLTGIDGDFPINTSGGLNAKGHPIGASGIAQVGEAFLQLRGEAGKRQVDGAMCGLTLSMAGFGNSATVTVLGV